MHKRLMLSGLWVWSAACAAGSAPPPESPAPTPPAPAAALPPAGASRLPVAQPGIDVLLADSAQLVRGRRVGLVTNRAGTDARGVADLARLRTAGVQVVALFSPEHGFGGTAAPGALVASTVDSATGLPIYSLYGRTSAPTDSMLEGIDVILVDLPDVGARYFTYLSTTVDVMTAAARRGLPVVILDRPNPLGGAVQGNVLDPRYASSIGRLAMPMRHGLTLGELARLARIDLGLEVKLAVVPAAGWRRSMTLDVTGLPFIPPSPNLQSLDALFDYPGTCLFEGTALSVGRGSAAPFEQFGAPWFDTTAVLARLREAPLRGVRFEGTTFTPVRPGDGRFADTLVAGIRLVITDRETYDPTITAVHLLATIQALYPVRIGWIPAHFDRLAGGPALREALVAGIAPDSIVAGWAAGRAAFEQRSQPVRIDP